MEIKKDLVCKLENDAEFKNASFQRKEAMEPVSFEQIRVKISTFNVKIQRRITQNNVNAFFFFQKHMNLTNLCISPHTTFNDDSGHDVNRLLTTAEGKIHFYTNVSQT